MTAPRPLPGPAAPPVGTAPFPHAVPTGPTTAALDASDHETSVQSGNHVLPGQEAAQAGGQDTLGGGPDMGKVSPPPSTPPAPDLVITAHGTPAGQGRVSFFGGHGVHSNAKTLKPWRKAIQDAACATAGTHPWVKPADGAPACALCDVDRRAHGLLAGPLAVEITVTVPKPKSAPKRRTTWPITRSSGDWDHHARAVCDALAQASVMADDSQIVEGTVRKVYPDEGLDALTRPGALIRIFQLTPRDTP